MVFLFPVSQLPFLKMECPHKLATVRDLIWVSRSFALQANLAVQENRLEAATKELDIAQAQLDEKQKELDKVQATYDATMAEKQVSISQLQQ